MGSAMAQRLRSWSKGEHTQASEGTAIAAEWSLSVGMGSIGMLMGTGAGGGLSALQQWQREQPSGGAIPDDG